LFSFVLKGPNFFSGIKGKQIKEYTLRPLFTRLPRSFGKWYWGDFAVKSLTVEKFYPKFMNH